MKKFDFGKSNVEPPLAPRWTALLFRLLIAAPRRDDVQGDLNEMHARRRARMGRVPAWLATSLEALFIAAALSFYRWRPRRPSMIHWLTWPELKLGARLIAKQPFLSLVAVLALAVGIGLATSGFAFVEAMLWTQLPYENGGRFVRIQAYSEPHGARSALDLERYHLLAESADRLQHVGGVRGGEVNLIADSGEVESITGAWITPRTFRHLPAVPLLGRTLIASDGRPGAPPVAVIRESLWKRRLGGSDGVLDQILDVSGVGHPIVGVLPDTFQFPIDGEIWLPLDEEYLGGSPQGPHPRVRLLGLLAPGATMAQAQAQLSTLSRQYQAAKPSAPEIRLRPENYTAPPDPAAKPMAILMLAILLVILAVVAFNVANVIRARTLSRRAELAVRTALGASRRRLVGQLFLEVLMMTSIAALVGLAGAQRLMEWMNANIDELPFWIVFGLTARTVTFVLFLALLAAAVAGVLPALRSTRIDPAATLQQEGRGHSGGFGRLGAAMVVLQMALSVALLSSALVMARGLGNYFDRASKLPTNKVLTAQVWIDAGTGEQANRAEPDGAEAAFETSPLARKRQSLLEAARHLPGLEKIGASNRIPPARAPSDRLEFESRAEESSGPVPWAAIRPGFLEALGGAPLQGRLLNQSDFRPGAAAVAVVNEPFARKYFPAGGVLGQRFRRLAPNTADSSPWIEIVGVVPDLSLSVGDPERAAGFYLPMALDRRDLFYLVLRAHDPLQLAGPLRLAAAEVDPAITVRRVMLLEDVGGEERAGLAGIAAALTAMGGMALLLSVMGIYAIMSFTVTARTREIGIRVALGADRGRILRTIAGKALALLLSGAALGCLLGVLFVQARAMFVFRFPDPELWIFGAVLGLMALAGLTACWLPTARALKISPTEALSR
ncbi:MAG TPA: ABC transporter permease [Acidobacteriota bacterium]|nr:ABC transporter permease [Acidobacteriota bacterium]